MSRTRTAGDTRTRLHASSLPAWARVARVAARSAGNVAGMLENQPARRVLGYSLLIIGAAGALFNVIAIASALFAIALYAVFALIGWRLSGLSQLKAEWSTRHEQNNRSPRRGVQGNASHRPAAEQPSRRRR